MSEIRQEKEVASVPELTIQIGKNTYVVGIHFNEKAKETMEDKIKKMIKEDMKDQKM